MKFADLKTDNKDTIYAVIETPYKSRNKYSYDPKTGLFFLSKVLPFGMVFPCDFGFIPDTEGGDGDPLDVLILMDELTFPGCVIECRLIGNIKARQKEKGKDWVRNDRLLAVPVEMKSLNHLQDIKDVEEKKLVDIVKFFEQYNERDGKRFSFEKFEGHKSARKEIKKGKKD
jgi:inorganic pyrophosphatase